MWTNTPIILWRRDSEKEDKKWYLAFMAGSITVGAILGLTLMYIIKVKFNFSALLGTLTGALIIIIINVFIILLKTDKTTEN
jgi:zinc transporter ZupT